MSIWGEQLRRIACKVQGGEKGESDGLAISCKGSWELRTDAFAGPWFILLAQVALPPLCILLASMEYFEAKFSFLTYVNLKGASGFAFSPRRIRIASYPRISRATVHNRISGKGQKCSGQGERRDIQQLLGLLEPRIWGSLASVRVRSSHEEIRLEEGFYFLFFICGCRIQVKFPTEEHQCLQSRNKMTILQ